MRLTKYFLLFLVVAFAFTGPAYAAWKKPGKVKSEAQIELKEWNNRPVLFEIDPGCWNPETKRFCNNTGDTYGLLLIDDKNPPYFTFSTRFKEVKILT